MLCFVFIIPLILQGLAQQTEQQKKKQTTCNDRDVHDAGDQFFTCFDVVVQNSIKHQNVTCDVPLLSTITNYMNIASKTCYNNSVVDEKPLLFIKLWEFSLKNDKYKNFVERKGVECIQEIKKTIAKCVSDETGVKDAGDKYAALWKKSKMSLDKMSCTETVPIKECTLKAMRIEENCSVTYKMENLLYVSSLFDYMLEFCHAYVEEWQTTEKTLNELPPAPGFATDGLVQNAHTTHVMLAVLLILAIAGMLYFVFRECRGIKTGNWKSINENFEMGRRRHSLVNNEVCQSVTPPPVSCK